LKYKCNHADDCSAACNHRISHDKKSLCLEPCTVKTGIAGSYCQAFENVKVKCESLATCEQAYVCNHVKEHNRRQSCGVACENPDGIPGSKCVAISKFSELPEELFEI